jgi:signal transduction histidine kinase
MDAGNLATLVNLLGFLAGASLYAMLLVMVLRGPAHAVRILNSSISLPTMRLPSDRLPLATGILGLAWNAAELASDGLRDLSGSEPPAWLTAAALTALGFLPAVVVHSVLGSAPRRAWWIGVVAYGLSATAAAMHLVAVATGRPEASDAALLMLTVGFSAAMVPLFVMTRRRAGHAVWIAALAVFAVSGFHLGHDSGHESWLVELAGHHASLPLALAILYQDYRFALADLFLKRALTLVLLVALVFGVYLSLGTRLVGAGVDPFATGLLLGMWIATALLYPVLRGLASWFVDTVVLRRADYGELRAAVGRAAADAQEVEQVLDAACRHLAPALSARAVRWRAAESNDAVASAPLDGWEGAPLVRAAWPGPGGDGAVLVSVLVPATDPPEYLIEIGELAGGRRLLSDDVQALEAVAYMVARRVDALRVSHERCVQSLREQEMGALATEAELRALRAQLNPHFLFNALTTIGYHIQVSPERALETLMRLPGLLRAVLKRSASEFTPLGEELDLVESYLAIERARLEERLRVRFDVPAGLRNATIPLFALQPLVENAVKHGIAPAKAGGEVVVSARVERGPGGAEIVLTVADTGLGSTPGDLDAGRERGIGLASIERRLDRHYGAAARLTIESAPGAGTTVELRMPAAAAIAPELATVTREGA